VFDFPASGQTFEVGPRPGLPLAASLAIHAGVAMLLLTVTFSDGTTHRPPPPRAAILLEPPPVIHAAAPTAQRPGRAPRRLFRVPLIRSVSAPPRESALVPALQIPMAEVIRPLLPTVELAPPAAAPAPPLRTDNFVPSAAHAPGQAASARVVSRSSGFEQIGIEPPRRGREPPVLGGEFADATMIQPGQSHPAGTALALPVPRSVEILSKPRPTYTEEARRQRIEGEVLLQILFAASGDVHVLRIVRGLGHGLDESAIAAAEAIRFRPAEQAGIAADSTAIVHIKFQLAF